MRKVALEPKRALFPEVVNPESCPNDRIDAGVINIRLIGFGRIVVANTRMLGNPLESTVPLAIKFAFGNTAPGCPDPILGESKSLFPSNTFGDRRLETLERGRIKMTDNPRQRIG
jgi:hypothetical protein